MKEINYPKIWGQGSIFASSGLETTTTATNSLVGSFLADRIGFEFKTPIRAYFYFKFNRNDVQDIEFDVITSDLVKGKLEDINGKSYEIIISFWSENTIIVKACRYLRASFDFDEDMFEEKCDDILSFTNGNEQYAFLQKEENNIVKMAFSYGKSATENVKNAILSDIEKDAEKKLEFYGKLPRPEFKDEDEEMLYYKCFSVMKSMIYSPEGRYNTYWSTPDRYPHKDCWLWDTAFHAVGLKYISPELAKDAIRAVLTIQHEDGYIPHQFSVDADSAVTQPPVLSWAVYELYKATGETDLAEELFDKLAGYLSWDMKNRDDNGNGLLEYVVNEDSITNRCDESGMDNSPRFDGESKMDCIDFSSFFANDARCLSKLAEAIGRADDAAYWSDIYEKTKNAINKYMWNDKDKFYYDRRMDGTLSSVKSVSSFLPLFAGICDEEQAKSLVEHLENPNEFCTAFPISTISADDKTYPTMDMFRGTVWLNFNYMIAQGLEKYGFSEKAEYIREITVEQVKKWYLSDGVIYEFYDSRDKVSPRRLARKGHPLQPYIPDVRIQCVHDFSWGSCFVPDIIIKRKK